MLGSTVYACQILVQSVLGLGLLLYFFPFETALSGNCISEYI